MGPVSALPDSRSETAHHRPIDSPAEQADAGDISLAIQPHFMLVPSLACQAECSYCFGPHRGPIMSPETIEAALDFMESIVSETGQAKVKVTFHGGEPLMAGHAIWRQALEGLDRRFGRGKCKVSLQSNLWLLDDEFCGLFREHKVEIGTSLDGPREITDQQRGSGYFDRTMAGVRKARSHGMTVGCIATFTPSNAPRWREVFDFFLAERLGMSIHASVPPLDRDDSRFALTPEQYGNTLTQILDYYVDHRREISVSSLDQMCQAVGCGAGKVCTFQDCLGMFLAIDPAGDIYPCQRICGRKEYALGNASDQPTAAELFDSPVARRMTARQERVKEVCKDCRHVDYCKGGCAYNACADGDNSDGRDPYCRAYQQVYDKIETRLLAEMGSEENINAVAARPFAGKGNPLLKKGPLIDLVREGPHPRDVARTARRIVAAVELARGPDIPSVAGRLVKMGVCRTQQSGEASLTALERRLQPRSGALNNLYLHLTFRCQLECTHCYARADAGGRQQPDMPVEALARLIHEARDAGFEKVVLTGGEPLVHHQRDSFLEILTRARSYVSPMRLALRTNLAMPLSDEDLAGIAAAVDQVIVSVDGSRETHDARRGKGTYDAVVRNLEAYTEVARTISDAGELFLATVMRSADIQGVPGDAVRQLAARLGVKRTRFRPLLPIGRAKDWDEPPTSEALGGHAEPMELIEAGFHPVSTCGLGQNLYVEPSGESFPCYAYHKRHAYLGNVITHGLCHVLDSERFGGLTCHNVDTNKRCKTCELRYLCGGACRAWGGRETQDDLDTAPPECAGLRSRARRLCLVAGEYLELDKDRE